MAWPAIVLVTGGAGSMGRAVCTRLADDGQAVRAFDLASANFVGLPDRVLAMSGDLTDPGDVADAVRGVDAVVHLAAILPPIPDEQYELARRVNVGGTQIVVDAMNAHAPAARLIFSSSVSVYGPPGSDSEITTAQDRRNWCWA